MSPAFRISLALVLSLALHAAALPLAARDAERVFGRERVDSGPIALTLAPPPAPPMRPPDPPAAPPPRPVLRQPPPAVEPAPSPAPGPKPAPKPKPVSKPKRPEPPVTATQTPRPTPEPQRPAPAPVVQAAVSRPPAVQAASSPGAEVRRRLEEEYKAALREALARYRRYPPLSRRLGQEGRVEVGFEVLADGRLRAVRVVRGSGHPRLDRAAVETVKRLGRFRPLPPELGRDRWELVLPLDYRLL